MKKKEAQTFKRQLVGGLVYTALAVAVTAAAVGGITSSFRKTAGRAAGSVTQAHDRAEDPLPDTVQPDALPKMPDAASFSLDTPLADLPRIRETAPVTDIEQGVDASLTQPETAEIPVLPSSAQTVTEHTEQTSAADRSVPVSEEPEEEYAGYGGYIRPCIGYVSREYAPDMPIYSPTMLDFRTHAGTDIACDIGTPVRAAAGGVIEDIYEDALLGTTVVIAHEDGVVSVYGNLSPDLPGGIECGRRVQAGDVIAGVGESACGECAEVSHLHFELWRDAEPVDPSDYLPQ